MEAISQCLPLYFTATLHRHEADLHMSHSIRITVMDKAGGGQIMGDHEQAIEGG